MTAEERQVQSDTQPGILPRQRDRLLAGGLVHHQAGGGENPLAMRPDYRLVDRSRAPKVIRVDDQPARCPAGASLQR